jgi:hypothetical protein
LNLHAACRVVIHFELPWTPARLHQRCGRVNRIGQTRRVHEIALIANDTAEQLVLEPLVRRAARSRAFSRTAIVRQLPESRVAAHILGGTAMTPANDTVIVVARMALGAEADEEVARLQLLRRLQGNAARGAPSSARGRIEIPIARVRPNRSNGYAATERGMTCVVELTLTDAAGDILAREIVGVRMAVRGAAWALSARVLRAQVEHLLARHKADMAAAVEPILADRLSFSRSLHGGVIAQQGLREAEMHRELRSAARQLVQGGLFDRRAVRTANARARMAEMVDEEGWTHAGAAGRNPGIYGRFSVRAVLCGGGP